MVKQVLVFQIAEWKFALDREFIIRVIDLNDYSNDLKSDNGNYILKDGDSITKIFDPKNILGVSNQTQTLKAIIYLKYTEYRGILVDRVFNLERINFEAIPDTLIFNREIFPLSGIMLSNERLVSLLNINIM